MSRVDLRWAGVEPPDRQFLHRSSSLVQAPAAAFFNSGWIFDFSLSTRRRLVPWKRDATKPVSEPVFGIGAYGCFNQSLMMGSKPTAAIRLFWNAGSKKSSSSNPGSDAAGLLAGRRGSKRTSRPGFECFSVGRLVVIKNSKSPDCFFQSTSLSSTGRRTGTGPASGRIKIVVGTKLFFFTGANLPTWVQITLRHKVVGRSKLGHLLQK